MQPIVRAGPMWLRRGVHVLSLIVRRGQINARGLAVIDGRPHVLGCVCRSCLHVAGGLAALGLRHGDRVAILAVNHASFLELQYAVLWAGGILVPVNYRLSSNEISYIVGAASACMIVADPQFERVVRDVARSVPALRRVIWFSGSEARGGSSYAWLAAQDAIEDRSECRADDTAGIYFTGGTTGRPKGRSLAVEFPQPGFRDAEFAGAARRQRLFARHTAVSSGGLRHRPRRHVRRGAHSFLAQFDANACLRKIIHDGVTEINLVPTMLATLLDAVEAEPRDMAAALAAVRTAAYGGAPIPAPLLHRLLARLPNAKFRQFYGMTETCGACTSLPPEFHVPGVDAAPAIRRSGDAVCRDQDRRARWY